MVPIVVIADTADIPSRRALTKAILHKDMTNSYLEQKLSTKQVSSIVFFIAPEKYKIKITICEIDKVQR